MANITDLMKQLQQHFGARITECGVYRDQVMIEVPVANVREICFELRDHANFHFEMMMDLCGVDYQAYGLDEWKKQSATSSGYSRGVLASPHWVAGRTRPESRFAVTYQLLSISKNQRLTVKTFLEEDAPIVDSVIEVWNSANWFEREAFDLFGILFRGHPDLRRILTDYGFIGHPFRKDFPLIGNVEMRYDAATSRCIYEPVGIQPRTLVPKVIRDDHRYLITEEEGLSHG